MELGKTGNFNASTSASKLLNITRGTFVLVVIVAEKQVVYTLPLILVQYIYGTLLTDFSPYLIIIALQISVVISYFERLLCL